VGLWMQGRTLLEASQREPSLPAEPQHATAANQHPTVATKPTQTQTRSRSHQTDRRATIAARREPNPSSPIFPSPPLPNAKSNSIQEKNNRT